MLMMAACPWLGWGGGVRNKKAFFAVLAAFVASGAAIWLMGYRQPTALLGAASSVAVLTGVVLQLADRSVRRQPNSLGALGAHLGMALMAIGIAFSGPYKIERDIHFTVGQTHDLAEYKATLLELEEGSRPGYEYIAAKVRITDKDGKELGVVAPERRLYEKFGSMQFSEVDVIPSLGDELYASLLGLDEDSHVVVKLSIEPLVNWLWIGGTLMCLVPLLGLRRRKPADAVEAADLADGLEDDDAASGDAGTGDKHGTA